MITDDEYSVNHDHLRQGYNVLNNKTHCTDTSLFTLPYKLLSVGRKDWPFGSRPDYPAEPISVTICYFTGRISHENVATAWDGKLLEFSVTEFVAVPLTQKSPEKKGF